MSRSAGPCELCGRHVPLRTRHHLIPRRTHRQPRIRMRYDRAELHARIAMLCRPCHNTLHATLNENELARSYNTLHALSNHPEIARFVAWVKKQPVDRRVGVRNTLTRDASKKRRR